MNLIKKLFSKTQAADPKYQRAAPRVLLTPLHRIEFANADGRIWQLGNLSSTGMALLNPGELAGGEELSGELRIDKEIFPIKAHVRHHTPVVAGCQFSGEQRDLRRAIESYLKVEILALSLNRVADQYLKSDPRGKVTWFTDGRKNEAYIITDDQGVVAFHLNFFGHYVEGGRIGKIRTGQIQDFDDSKTDPGYKGASLVDLSNEATGEILGLARSFVQNLEKLDVHTRAELDRQLNS